MSNELEKFALLLKERASEAPYNNYDNLPVESPEEMRFFPKEIDLSDVFIEEFFVTPPDNLDNYREGAERLIRHLLDNGNSVFEQLRREYTSRDIYKVENSDPIKISGPSNNSNINHYLQILNSSIRKFKELTYDPIPAMEIPFESDFPAMATNLAEKLHHLFMVIDNSNIQDINDPEGDHSVFHNQTEEFRYLIAMLCVPNSTEFLTPRFPDGLDLSDLLGDDPDEDKRRIFNAAAYAVYQHLQLALELYEDWPAEGNLNDEHLADIAINFFSYLSYEGVEWAYRQPIYERLETMADFIRIVEGPNNPSKITKVVLRDSIPKGKGGSNPIATFDSDELMNVEASIPPYRLPYTLPHESNHWRDISDLLEVVYQMPVEYNYYELLLSGALHKSSGIGRSYNTNFRRHIDAEENVPGFTRALCERYSIDVPENISDDPYGGLTRVSKEIYERVLLGALGMEMESNDIALILTVLNSYRQDVKHAYQGPYQRLYTFGGNHYYCVVLPSEHRMMDLNQIAGLTEDAKLQLVSHLLISMVHNGAIESLTKDDLDLLQSPGTDLDSMIISLKEKNEAAAGGLDTVAVNSLAMQMYAIGVDTSNYEYQREVEACREIREKYASDGTVQELILLELENAEYVDVSGTYLEKLANALVEALSRIKDPAALPSIIRNAIEACRQKVEDTDYDANIRLANFENQLLAAIEEPVTIE
ncbi:MAG: hypothetical protein GF364_02740 [Candidatus Lokiarchaeota archaeon]|nr:hypothetical protein [Candidatus Lokiarchaeota archaeon]